MAALVVAALCLLLLMTARSPRASATYRLPGQDISWLAAGAHFLLIGQREGRLAKLTSDLSELGSGWVRPFTHPAGFYGRPVVAGERVLVSCADGRLRAVDLRTGEQAWAKIAWLREADPLTGDEFWGQMASGPVGEAAVAGGAAFFGADNGWLYAVELSTGRALWEADLGGSVVGAPLVTEHEVIVGTLAGVVHCLSRGDGRKLWRFPRTEQIGPVYASPRRGLNCIVVGSDDGKVYDLLPTGELRGSYELGGLIRAPAAVESGAAIVGDSGGELCRVSTGDMHEIWHRDLSHLGGITV